MNWIDIVDWFLRIVQIMSFIGLILKISFQTGYIDNVGVEAIEEPDSVINDKRFHRVDNYEHTENPINYFLFYPKGTDIKWLDFYSLRYDNEGNELAKFLNRREYIRNHTALLIRTTIMGVTPILKLKWETNSGELGEYTVQFNGFNGNTDIKSYKYKLTWKRKILSIFGL